MKFLSLILAFLLFLAPFFSFAEDVLFLPGFDDIPLMEGIEIDREGDVMFDTTTGRIGSIIGVTQNSLDKVHEYYGDSLKQLGWVEIVPGEYIREGEKFLIRGEPTKGDDATTLHITIEPLADI